MTSVKPLATFSQISAAPRYSWSKSGRLGEMRSIVPGPGSYSTAAITDGQGQPFTEIGVKFGKRSGYSWGRAARRRDFPDATKDVGPGSYYWEHDLSRPQSVRGGGSTAPRAILRDSSTARIDPGPGQYEHRHFFGNGPSYTPSRSQRFGSNQMRVPGPGAYNPNGSVSSAKARQGVSLTASIGAKMSKQARYTSYWDSKTPGPGQYESPSIKASRYCLRENRLLVVSCAIVYDPSFFDDELPLISSINMISEGSGILDARGEEAAEIE